MNNINRRDFLRNFGIGALALGASVVVPTIKDGNGNVISKAFADTLGPSAKRKRSIRIAHLTDMHVEPELHSAEGFAKCLHHVQSQKDTPELILFGGDQIMDSTAQVLERTDTEWDLFHSTLKNENSLPYQFCIGNHDVWGWYKDRAHTTGAEKDFGKKMACEQLGLSQRYYSLDKAGWRFIILDSIFPVNHDEENRIQMKGCLDDDQFSWLEDDLKANANKPILIMSHVPLLTVTSFVTKKPKGESYSVSDISMHEDWPRLKALFLDHPNIKLALSGHNHLLDRVDYNGVSYLCNGAVSGAWWKGPNIDCHEGYAIVDLYDDGSFEHEYVAYGWKAQA